MPEEPCGEPSPDDPEVTCDKDKYACAMYHMNREHPEVPPWPNTDRPTAPSPTSRRQKRREIVSGIEPEKRTGPPDLDRDGKTYVREFDYERLNAQARRVYDKLKDGQWWTLADLSWETNDPESSISARIRDLRKPEFGGLKVDRRRLPGHEDSGVHQYRLMP